MATPVVPIFTLESKIKRKLRAHLKNLGFIRNKDGLLELPNNDKDTFRMLHRVQRANKLTAEAEFIKEKAPLFLKYFASGSDIIPDLISPQLQLVRSNSLEADIFRFASLTWSIPVSNGYGRRMRFLVWDESNGKLIGLIALGDPVFNLKVRDSFIGWSGQDRKERLVNLMDAYVLGALPPYNMLLGGKLVSCLIRTQEVRDIFAEKYGNTCGLISGKQKNASLVLVTTSSALGRSSVYNRLSINGTKYFQPVGYTAGWGHFHIPDTLFLEMRNYLKIKEHAYFKDYKFGSGPNWRLRTVRAVLDILGMNSNMLKHGIVRQVYLCRLASNWEKVLSGETIKPKYKDLQTVKEVSELAINRWILPRSERNQDYMQWRRENILELLKSNKNKSNSYMQMEGSTTKK